MIDRFHVTSTKKVNRPKAAPQDDDFHGRMKRMFSSSKSSDHDVRYQYRWSSHNLADQQWIAL